jgi:hypothetical protein
VKQHFGGNTNYIIPISKIPFEFGVCKDFKELFSSLIKFIDDIIIRDALHCVPNVLFFDESATVNIHWNTNLFIDYVSDGVVYHGFYCINSSMTTIQQPSFYYCSFERINDMLLCLMAMNKSNL